MDNKFFIVAGDPSGDIHSAKLMKEIKLLMPDAEFVGIGGSLMEAEGLKSIVPISMISVVGFWEVAKKYSFFTKLLEQCKNLIKSNNFKAFIAVDYPGFNMKLAQFAKSIKTPVVYYIAPQLWAWGKNRAVKLSKIVDLLLVVFPFEVDFFQNFNINTKFVGHPLLDDERFSRKIKRYTERTKNIALLPGSRKQEIIKHLPMIIETAKILHQDYPDFQISIAKSSNIEKDLYLNFLKNNSFIELIDDNKELMSNAIAGAVKTGTSNLESCLLGMPFVMYYKTSALTYFLGRKLVNLPYISLVNILSNLPIIPELIQNDANPKNIAFEISKLINDGEYYDNIQSKFLEIRNNLGSTGASRRAAEMIVKS